MSVDLCGWRVDGGTGMLLNALEPRAFRAVAFASGVANKIQIMGHTDGTARCAIYANNAGNNRPSDLLAVTTSFSTSAGVVAELELSAPINIVSGTSYQINLVQETSASRIRAGTIPSTQRTSGSAMSAISDDFADPFSFSVGGTVTVGPYAMLISDSVAISGIDQLRTGQTSTATFNGDFAAASFNIAGGEITKNAAAFQTGDASATFIMPWWEDGETCVKIGPVVITATDGTDTTESFNGNIEFWDTQPDEETAKQFAVIELASLAPSDQRLDSVMGWSPAWQVGAQIVYDASRGEFDASGVYGGYGSYVGDSHIYARNPDEKIARRKVLTTSESGIVVPPVMPADRTVTVYEGATTLGTFPAASGTQPISYALGGDDAALFTINSETAKVDPVGTLTDGQSGAITVTATNSEGSDSQTITFTVVAVPGTTQGAMETARMEVIKMESISMQVINMEVLK